MSVVTPFVAGPLTAAQLNGFLAAWDTYTPTWTGATGNPAIGNGTLTGSYLQIGKTVDFLIVAVMGSTTTYGTGQWSISLPPVAALSASRASFVLDMAVAGSSYTGAAILTSTTAMQLVTPGTTAGGPNRAVATGIPGAWAAGNTFTVTGRYEAA